MVVSDSCSSSNFADAKICHIHLDWTVDLAQKYIYGTANYECEIFKDTDVIILDGRVLDIQEVNFEGNTCKYSVADAGIYGQKITLNLGLQSAGSKLTFSITYKTTSGATALQFVEPELTSDRLGPFLYSQCEAIHARSIVPCMDTPSVKQTYSANVKVPKGLVCLMSALSEGKVENSSDVNATTTTYSFMQPILIPSYLIAIVVGVLERRNISERCAIWAEPSQSEKARWEFERTEEMLSAAEELVGEYSWKRYDMVLLPPFFPFGGMENPMLTFLTPTIIAGDRSLTDVIAHEIAHSWTGNWVTNANWENFWLNEGFTQFLERKIVGRLFGEEIRQFKSLCGFEGSLRTTVYDQFSPTHEFTKLSPNLDGCDPDDAFSTIPYEKGSALLFYIEQQLGDAEEFNRFLKSYVSHFAQKSITKDDFIRYLYEYFADKKAVLDAIDFDKWICQPGMPPVKPNYDLSLKVKCDELANKLVVDDLKVLNDLNSNEFLQISTSEKLKVLDIVRNGNSITPERAAIFDKKFSLSRSGNCEILFRWILMALKAKYAPIIELALNFVRDIGRMKYIRPVYKLLFEWSETREKAIDLFGERSPFMHPISAHVIQTLLKTQ